MIQTYTVISLRVSKIHSGPACIFSNEAFGRISVLCNPSDLWSIHLGKGAWHDIWKTAEMCESISDGELLWRIKMKRQATLGRHLPVQSSHPLVLGEKISWFHMVHIY